MEFLKDTYEFGGITYLVYSNGEIYGSIGMKIQPRENGDGYLVVSMGNKRITRSTRSVHRIVAELFLPNPNNLSDVDHVDGNRTNPDVTNLEWVTHEENVRRAYKRGSHIGRIHSSNICICWFCLLSWRKKNIKS